MITMSDLLKVKSILKKTPAPDACSGETDTTNTSSNYAESTITGQSSTDSDSAPAPGLVNKQKRVHFRSHESLDRKLSAEEQRRDIVRAITDAYDRVNRHSNDDVTPTSSADDAASPEDPHSPAKQAGEIEEGDVIEEAEYANGDVRATEVKPSAGEVTVSGSTVAIEIGENGEWRTSNVSIATHGKSCSASVCCLVHIFLIIFG